MVQRNRRLASVIGLVCALFLSSCGDQSVAYKKPVFGFLSKYTEAQDSTPVLLSNAEWWQGLNDPALNQLIALALQDNLSLELAHERVVAALAARDGVPGKAILTPSAQIEASNSNTTDSRIVASSQLGLSWMLDPYGARRNEIRAASARIQVAQAEVEAARLLVLFNTANAYVSLRHAQQTLAQRRDELARRQSTLNLTRHLQDAESSTALEVIRSRARVLEIRSQLPALDASITAGLNELTVLTGRVPGTLPRDLDSMLRSPAGQPAPRLSPDVGIPTDLLRNRPDIQIAERSYYAAVAEVGIARAGLYPRLSLSGAITLNALGGRQSAGEYYFGPTVALPSIPLKPAREAVKARNSAVRQAYTVWKTTVLNAILEVENSLVAYEAANTSLASAQGARSLYSETLALTRKVFKSGEATLGNLIDAEEALAQSDRNLTDLRMQYALRFIALNVRLGSGHQSNVR